MKHEITLNQFNGTKNVILLALFFWGGGRGERASFAFIFGASLLYGMAFSLFRLGFLGLEIFFLLPSGGIFSLSVHSEVQCPRCRCLLSLAGVFVDLWLCLFWLDPAFVDFQGPNVLILYRYNMDLFSWSAVLLFFQLSYSWSQF